MRRTLALCVLAAACYPDNNFSATPSDAVITVFDSATDFASARTYQMPSDIVHLNSDGSSTRQTGTTDQLIIQKIQANMTARGYTQVPDSATSSDFLVLSVVSTYQNIGYYTYGYASTWGYYGAWYGAGWGYTYPVYAVPYQYQTGTVVTVMLDSRRKDPAKKNAPVGWAFALNGDTTSSTTGDVATRVGNGIDQAFKQSPYVEAK
jgi:hypothetical protein